MTLKIKDINNFTNKQHCRKSYNENIILNYLNRKSIKSKIQIKISNKVIKSLVSLVESLGPDVFNRNKKLLTVKTINETIPTMINHCVKDIKSNLDKIKLVKRNSLDHYNLLYNDKAKVIYNERTKKSLQTKENFIKRHGKEKGSRLWNEYSKNKSKQNTLAGFQERFGNELGEEKFKQYSDRQKYTNSLEYYVELYGNDKGYELYKKRYPSKYNLKEFSDYKKLVYKLSNKNYNNNKSIINPNNYLRTRMSISNGWQLDHIKPVNECFKEGIPPEEASSIENLRMLPWKTNLMRNFK